MEKNLIIDGRNLGPCTGYRRRGNSSSPELDAWVFRMEAGYTVTVEMIQIKLFTSCPDLEIILYH